MTVSKWQQLIDFVQRHQCHWPLNPDDEEWGIHQFDTPPHNRLLGPVFPRGETAGLVSIGGEVQCQWGETARADMTFSVTKSYLAMVTWLAVRDGLIKSVDEPVRDTLRRNRLHCKTMEYPQNRTITWRHFLQFTSEWQGECFGVPDQVDHFRIVSMQPGTHKKAKGELRSRAIPGEYWEYNDVRINQFALLLTRLFDRAIPEVFTEQIMQPLGASSEWRWHGYDNSHVPVSDGRLVKSVPGGGHWGGGVVISVEDQWLLARLLLNKGAFDGRQLLAAEWVEAMTAPCNIAPWYGFFMWLNTDHCISRAAPASSYFSLGVGGQLIWHAPEMELIAIFRWINSDYTEQMVRSCMNIAKRVR